MKANKLKSYRKICFGKRNEKGMKKGVCFNLTTLTEITTFTY